VSTYIDLYHQIENTTQSGDTNNSISALRQAKRYGAKHCHAPFQEVVHKE